ncbi:MAG: hypothetical protein JST92_19465 [Deltaproteobacteria bacterium]|nr:hypothetical protein [Deltaproteobacteria bacterium]
MNRRLAAIVLAILIPGGFIALGLTAAVQALQRTEWGRGVALMWSPRFSAVGSRVSAAWDTLSHPRLQWPRWFTSHS